MTKQNRNVIVDQDANRVCNLSGLTKAEGHIDRLEKELAALDIALKEAEAERDRERTTAKLLLAAKVIKSSCDGFINLAAEFAEYIPGVREGARKVKTAYDTAVPVANIGGTLMAGGKPDYMKDGAGLIKGTSGYIKNDGISYVVKKTGSQIETINASMNSNKEEVRRSIEEQGLEISKLASIGYKVANDLDKNTKTRYDRFNTALSIAKVTNDYNKALDEAIDEFFDFTSWSDEKYASKKGNYMFKVKQARDHLNEARKFISDCEAELAETQPVQPVQPPLGQALSLP